MYSNASIVRTKETILREQNVMRKLGIQDSYTAPELDRMNNII